MSHLESDKFEVESQTALQLLSASETDVLKVISLTRFSKWGSAVCDDCDGIVLSVHAVDDTFGLGPTVPE
jgi:hypothetical protein